VDDGVGAGRSRGDWHSELQADSGDLSTGVVVLRAKITAPRPRGLVRPRLLARLDGVWSRQLGLVVAPAGSGKTTMLAHYAAGRRIPAAWFRAERSDGDVGRLVRHLQEAVASALGVRPGRSGDLDDMLAELERWPGGRALVVLDDLHHLDGTPAAAAVDRLVALAPPNVRVLAASRTPPGLDLSRLRLAEDLCEITADDLRFRSWEVERLFREVYGEPLPPGAVDELTARTGGWAAGLQLVHLSPEGAAGRPGWSLAGRTRLAGTYLACNVLADLSAGQREFIRRTCVLGLLIPALCDRLLGSTCSAARLEELEHLQLCRPAGERAYRYPPLLQDHLERELYDELGGDGLAAAHRAAGRLLETAGEYADAVRAYARGEDWGAVRQLLHLHGEQVADDVSGCWAEVLPAHVLDDDPWLLLAAARQRYAAGQLDRAADLYDRAEQGFGNGAARRRCRQEREAVAVWDAAAPRTGSTWYECLRAATRDRPLAHARRALTETGPAGTGPAGTGPRADLDRLLAAGFGMLLAGHFGAAAGHLRAAAAARPGSGGGRALAARVGLLFIRRCTPDLPEDSWMEGLALDADLRGLPWLARTTRALAALAPDPGGLAEVDAVRSECERDGDCWGAMLATLLDGLGRLVHQRPAGPSLERAAVLARQLDAGVLEAWARGLLAIELARTADPDADVAAGSAEACARAAEVPGARALALLALALARTADPDEHRTELLALARALLADCGLPMARVLSWLRLPALPADAVPARAHRPAAAPVPRPVPAPADPPALEVRLLGGFELRIAGREPDWARLRPRARTTLRLLALHAGRPVHRETLVEALWPDLPPAAGMHSLQVAVSSLRRFLDPDAARGGCRLLARAGDTYRLTLPPGSHSDLAEFEAALRTWRELHSARPGAPPTEAGVAALRRALALYRGPLLPEDGPAEWVVAERDRLRHEAAEAAVALGGAQLRRGDAAAAAEALERGLRIDPFRDTAWRLLIGAYELVGDLAAAGRARREYARVLAELDVDASGTLVTSSPSTPLTSS